MRQQSYQINLPQLMTVCEHSYAKLMQLLPAEEQTGKFVIVHVGNLSYRITITMAARYTTEVEVVQLGQQIMGLISPQLLIRIYHDVRIAEVISSDYLKRVKPAPDYPNPQMHHKDEKYQINAFLLDWLSHCLSHGRTNCMWDVKHGLV